MFNCSLAKIRHMGFEFFILLVVFFIILAVPTKEDKEQIPLRFRELLHCKKHKWVQKQLKDNNSYTICSECGFKPTEDLRKDDGSDY